MSEEKRKRLEKIKSEVDELHPLLKILFEKMPDIRHIEYTHGKDEMGADFVLSRFDDTFGTIDYIGVIAKLGKIVQDFTDIDKQIDECSVPRPYLGGKEKILIRANCKTKNSLSVDIAQAAVITSSLWQN